MTCTTTGAPVCKGLLSTKSVCRDTDDTKIRESSPIVGMKESNARRELEAMEHYRRSVVTRPW